MDSAGTPATTPVVAAFDIGSNTIKMTVARPGANNVPEALAYAAETVRLGAGLEASGRLADDRVAAALDTLRRFTARARDLGAARLVGVATEAARTAANGPDVLDRIRRETGIEVQTISGDEEAELTFRGLAASVDLSGPIVVADIGGGSTEVIVAEAGAVRSARSFRLGSGTLTERLVLSDPPTAAEIAACRAAAAETLKDAALPDEPGARLVVVGGTGEYLARLLPGGGTVTEVGIAAVLAHVQSAPAAAIAPRLGIPEARARVLPAGVSIVQALAERMQPREIIVTQSGIRTGLLLRTFAEMGQSTVVESVAGDQG